MSGKQLEMFPQPELERQMEMFEPAPPAAEPEAALRQAQDTAPKERRRHKLLVLDDPRRPRNRRPNNPMRRVTLAAAILTAALMPALADDRPICQSTAARDAADKADVARIEHKLDVLATCLLLHHCDGSRYPWVPAH